MSDNIIVKYSEFFKDDGGLKKVRDDFYQLSKELIEKAEEVREKTKLLGGNDTAAISEQLKKIQELTEANKGLKDAASSLANVQKQVDGTRKKSTAVINAETEAVKKQNAEKRNVAKLQNTVTGSIENLRAKLTLVTTAWSKLTEEETLNTQRGKRIVASKKEITETLKRLESAAGDNRRNVGGYLASIRGSLISLSSAAGLTLSAFGAFRLLRNSISVIRDYEKQNATLSAVLQTNIENIGALIEDSKRLGIETVKSATEVAELQTEYARLGFTQQEILDLTEPTIQGSIALNSELSDTAKLVGAVVKSYDNLSTTDAPEILDILSLATAKSALNFEKLQTGLPITLGAANALRIPFTELVATLGKLSDAGIDTSTASTALRNIFIEAAAKGLNYKEALSEITRSTDKLTTANKIFGKRAAVSSLVIANNTKNVELLDEALRKAKGTAKEMSDKELNTLDGAIKLLQSAWTGLILDLNDTTNSANRLASSIVFLARNMTTIAKVIGISTAAYFSYSVTVKAANAVEKIKILLTGASTAATNLQTASTVAATAAQRSFNAAVKANPLGTLIALLAAAVTAYYAFGESASYAEREQKAINRGVREGAEQAKKNLEINSKATTENLELLRKEISLRRAKGENERKLDKEYLERQRDILLVEVEKTQKDFDASEIRIKKLESKVKLAKKERDEAVVSNAVVLSTGTGGAPLESETERQQDSLEALEKNLGKEIGLRKARNRNIASLGNEIQKIDEELAIKAAQVTVELSKEQLKRIKELEMLKKRLEDLQDESIKLDPQREKAIITRKYDREIAAIKGNSEIEIKLRTALEERKQSELDAVDEKYEEIRLDLLKRSKKIENDIRQRSYEKEKFQLIENNQEILNEIKKNTAITDEEKAKLIIEANKKLNKEISDLNVTFKLEEIEKNKELEEAYLIQDLEQKRKNFKKEEDFEKFKQRELLKIQLKALKSKLDVLQAANDEDFKVQIESIKAQIAVLGNEIDSLGKDLKVDKFKEFAKELKDIFTEAARIISEKLSESIEKSRTALEKQQKAVEDQRTRAQNGLKNTLAFEQRQEAKREAELLKKQKRLDKINKLTSYWNTYNANLSSLEKGQDSNVAITKTLKSIAIIEALTASVASFGEGGIVEDKLPQNGIFRGESHNGPNKGIPILVEGKEGIFSVKEMENLGKDNFYRIKNMAANGPIDNNHFSQQKTIFIKDMNKNISYDPQIISELRNVKNAISSKPSQLLNVPEIVNGVLEFTETISSTNTTKRNHYKIKKPRI